MAVKWNDPIASYRFIVEIEDGGKTVTAAFSYFSGVKMRTETIPVRSGSDLRGVMDCIQGLTSIENVTLRKGVIGDSDFLEWVASAAPDADVVPSAVKSFKTINVVALNANGVRAVSWTLYNAQPVSYEMSEMDSTQSAVLSESLEFAITGFKRTTLLKT